MKRILVVLFTLCCIYEMNSQECAFELLDNASLRDFYIESSSRCSDDCLDVCDLQQYYEIPVAVHIINDGEDGSAAGWPNEDLFEFWMDNANEIHGDHINLVRADEYYPCVDFYNIPDEQFVSLIPEGEIGANEIEIYSKSRYNPEKILNVYVVKFIIDPSSPNEEIRGLSRTPLNPSWNLDVDGIVIGRRHGGGLGGEILAHELGHYLNLLHIWGAVENSTENCHEESEGCTKGDLVPDTEPCHGRYPFAATNGCVTHPSLWEDIFESQGGGPFCNSDMKFDCNNIMAYGSGREEVSDGQFNRMISAINEFRLPLLPSTLDPSITEIGQFQAKLVWNESVNSGGYVVRIRKASESNFTEHIIDDEQTISFLFANLDLNTEYVVQIETVCGELKELSFTTLCPSQTACDPCSQRQDLIINSDQTLTDTEIRGNIIINAGATLKINTQVEFAEDSGILVKRGGKLIVNGGILTNCSSTERWNGIKAEGLTYDPYGNVQPQTSQRPEITVINQSVIENANIGIDAKDQMTVNGNIFDIGGAKVTVDGSTMTGCGNGIVLGPYGYGAVQTPFGLQDAVEQSTVNNSTFFTEQFSILLDRNKGCQITLCTFDQGGIWSTNSKFYADENTFNPASMIHIDALYPNALGGGEITNNTFIENGVFVAAMSNASLFTVEQNQFLGGWGLESHGMMFYDARNNDFLDCNTGLTAMETGPNNINLVMDNAFLNNDYGASISGDNNGEFLVNCFENTQTADVELNIGSSIREDQGTEDLAAGNCFNEGIATKILIGTSGTSTDEAGPFTNYWTKVGFESPLGCKHPGVNQGYNIEQAQEEPVLVCGSDNLSTAIGNLPARYRDCKPNTWLGDDIDEMIDQLEEEIRRIENNPQLTPSYKAYLISKYRECIDSFVKQKVREYIEKSDGEPSEKNAARDWLLTRPEFEYQIIAYGLTLEDDSPETARQILGRVSANTTAEYSFMRSQGIYLDYLESRSSYSLFGDDHSHLRAAAIDRNVYAPYSGAILRLLTGEDIRWDRQHVDGSTSPRVLSSKSKDITVRPNPVNEDVVTISNISALENGILNIYSITGQQMKSIVVNQQYIDVDISMLEKGIYIITLQNENGKLEHTEKLVRL